MNKVLKKIGLLIATAILCTGATAEGKVKSIDLNRALSSSNVAQQQFKRMQADASFKSISAKIQSLKLELQNLQKEGETKSLTWSEDQKKQHVQKMQLKLGELNQTANQQASIRKGVEAAIEKELAPKVEAIVNIIIKEQDIGLLLNAQAVYFRTPEHDITQLVIERLNSAK